MTGSCYRTSAAGVVTPIRIMNICALTSWCPPTAYILLDSLQSTQAPPDRVVTHIVPKYGTHGAVLVAYAEPTKFKLLAIGSRGLGAVKLCATLLFA